jgi:hypothetical protein
MTTPTPTTAASVNSSQSSNSISSIQVSPDDFLKVNKALIRILLTLYECGGSLPTRQLYNNASMNWSHGWRMVCKAEREGYINRTKIPRRAGEKGNHMMVNKLTPKALSLLERLDLTTPHQ